MTEAARLLQRNCHAAAEHERHPERFFPLPSPGEWGPLFFIFFDPSVPPHLLPQKLLVPFSSVEDVRGALWEVYRKTGTPTAMVCLASSLLHLVIVSVLKSYVQNIKTAGICFLSVLSTLQ